MKHFKESRGESASKNYHKEEAMAQTASDREVLQSNIEIFHPLKPKLHPEELVMWLIGTLVYLRSMWTRQLVLGIASG